MKILTTKSKPKVKKPYRVTYRNAKGELVKYFTDKQQSASRKVFMLRRSLTCTFVSKSSNFI